MTATKPTVPTKNATSGRYEHIDALRAFAVSVVVVAHAGLGSVIPGGSGVTVFFGISGFIITFLVIRERETTGGFDIRGFYLRRALKLAPPLIVVVAIPTLIYAAFRPIEWSSVVSQFAFYYNWVHVGGRDVVLPGSQVLWSLSIEEQFYVVFAILWAFLYARPGGLRALAVLASAAILVSMVLKFAIASGSGPQGTLSVGGANWRIYYGTDTRMDALAIGVLGAIATSAWQQGSQRLLGLRRWVASDAALLTAAVLYLVTLVVRDSFFRDTVRYPLQAVAAVLVVVGGLLVGQGGGLAFKLLRWVSGLRGVRLLGLASYSIYLVHFSLQLALEPSLRSLPEAVRIGIAIAVSFGVGIVVYLIVERPLESLKSRLRRDPGLPPSRSERPATAST